MKTYRITAIVSSTVAPDLIYSLVKHHLDKAAFNAMELEVEHLGSHCPTGITAVLEHFKKTYGPALPQVREAK